MLFYHLVISSFTNKIIQHCCGVQELPCFWQYLLDSETRRLPTRLLALFIFPTYCHTTENNEIRQDLHYHRDKRTVKQWIGLNYTLCLCRWSAFWNMYRQIMEYTGRCVAVTEPNSPSIVATKYRKLGDSWELRQLTRDVIRWECRPYPTMQPPPLGYILKLIAPCVGVFPMLRQITYCQWRIQRRSSTTLLGVLKYFW